PSDQIFIGDYVFTVEAAEGEGAYDEGYADEGYADDGYADDGHDAGYADEGYADEGYADDGYAEDGYADDGYEDGYDEPEGGRMPASMAAAMARGAVAVDPRAQEYARLQKDIHDRLIEYLDLRRLDIDRLGDEELWRRTEKAIRDIIEQMEIDGELPEYVDPEEMLTGVLNEALGLGPLEAFLASDEISEVLVNHANQIYIEYKGKLQLSDKIFSSNQAVLGVIERIVAPIGRRIDESSPLVDARLKDGSRVNAIIPPLALKGPCITIRKFKKDS